MNTRNLVLSGRRPAGSRGRHGWGKVAALSREPAQALPSGLTDIARCGMVSPPGTRGADPGSSVGQMDFVFHELHADGRHALCAMCGDPRGR